MKKILTLYCLLLSAYCVAADWSPRERYSCGFELEELKAEKELSEEDARNGIWTLNIPRNTNFTWPTIWELGEATASSGDLSLYISSDGGASMSYMAVSCIMMAWHEMTLAEGTYNIALDWRCVGGGHNNTFLRVVWVPVDEFEDSDNLFACGSSNVLSGASRAWMTDYALSFESGTNLCESSGWTRSVASLKSDGRAHRLVVLWVNNGQVAACTPGAAVDNIEIAPASCAAPENLTISTEESVVTVAWTSEHESVNIRYYNVEDGEVHEVQDVRGTQYQTSLPYGVYKFQVQAVCGGVKSVWYPLPTTVIYDSPCFNYLALSDENCYYSIETPSDWHKARDSMQAGCVDYGYESYKSYHTIHYVKDERDVRTAGSYDRSGRQVAPLRTVPEGAIASVRIGNWEENMAHLASVQYEFTVDAEEEGALMLQYAVVMQSSGHDAEHRPRFTLSVEDAETHEPLSTCTYANFEPPTSEFDWKENDGWYMTSTAKKIEETTVCWRDWTNVGINLHEYDGRTVRVVLIAYGCTAEVHWGYAYFTLTCTSGEIEGVSCGDEPTRAFTAPDGYAYNWYRADNPSTLLSKERVFPVEPSDTNTYMVELTYLSNDQCSFTLSANATPRYPVAEAKYTIERRDCQNYVKFQNSSYIRKKIYRRDGTFYYVDNGKKTRPEQVYWETSTGDFSYDWEPEFRLPSVAGTYMVSLRAKLGQCDSIIQIPVKVQNVGPDTIVTTKQLCLGDWYEHKGQTYTEDTTIVYHGYNRFGCDSIDTLHIRFVEKLEVQLYDTIREGETYMFGGREYSADAEAWHIDASRMGCDSVTYLHLTMVPWLQTRLDSFAMPCQGEWSWPITLHTEVGTPQTGQVLWDEKAINLGWKNVDFEWEESVVTVDVPMTDSIPAGWYDVQIVSYSSANGTDTIRTEVMIQYSDTLVRQRWNDVIGVLNAEHNGGLEFVSYQWYENDVQIAGATAPYLYIEGGFKQGSVYSVELLAEGQTRGVRTCAYSPVVWQHQQVSAESTVRKYVREGSFLIERDGCLYDLFGRKIQ